MKPVVQLFGVSAVNSSAVPFIPERVYTSLVLP